MSHRQPKTKTTIPGSEALGTMQQAARQTELDKNSLVEANRNSATRDQTRSISDQPPSPTDLGSRWCPEEIEIFFTSKLAPLSDILILNLSSDF